MTVILDAKDLIIGRFATRVAKMALLGETIAIVNCEQAVLSGSKDEVIANYKRKKNMGIHTKGPFITKVPERFVKRILRGMFAYKQPRGREAFERVKCYNKIPKQFQDEKFLTLEEANKSKLPNLKYITVKELCEAL